MKRSNLRNDWQKAINRKNEQRVPKCMEKKRGERRGSVCVYVAVFSAKAATGAKVERQRGEENSRNKERANHPLELIRKVVARVVVVPALFPQVLGLAVALGGFGLVGGPVYCFGNDAQLLMS